MAAGVGVRAGRAGRAGRHSYLEALQSEDGGFVSDSDDSGSLEQVALEFLQERTGMRGSPVVPEPVESPAPKRKHKVDENGKRDTTSMNCKDCHTTRATWGLPDDGKKLWCAACGRNHLREGAQLIKRIGDGACEDCVQREAHFGMPVEWDDNDQPVTAQRGLVGGKVPGQEKLYRWCRACAVNHPGCVNNRPTHRPKGIAARKLELEKRREARIEAKKERRKQHRKEIKAGKMKEPVSSYVLLVFGCANFQVRTI